MTFYQLESRLTPRGYSRWRNDVLERFVAMAPLTTKTMGSWTLKTLPWRGVTSCCPINQVASSEVDMNRLHDFFMFSSRPFKLKKPSLLDNLHHWKSSHITHARTAAFFVFAEILAFVGGVAALLQCIWVLLGVPWRCQIHGESQPTVPRAFDVPRPRNSRPY